MLTSEQERLLNLEKPISGQDWSALKVFYRETFGKSYGSKCICNAHNVIKSLRKKFGYAPQD